MKISLICYKPKANKVVTKKKVKTVRYVPVKGCRHKYRNLSHAYYAGRGQRAKPAKNNLQLLYKRKSMIDQKLRVRKFKLRIRQDTPISRRSPANGLTVPRWMNRFGLKLKKAVRLSYATFIGMEKTFMPSKGTAKIFYRKYPDFFVTKKSSKSRMGKGKGKISGRVLKLRRGEVIVDLKFRNYFKSEKYIKALRRAIPCKTQLVWRSRWARRLIYNSRRNRPWKAYRERSRRKKWQKALDRIAKRRALKVYPRQINHMFSIKYDTFRKYMVWKLQPRAVKTNEEKSDERNHLLSYFKLWRRYGATTVPRLTRKVKRRRTLRRYRRSFTKNTVRMTPLSGGRARSFKMKWILGFWGVRKFYEQQFLPDVDGFYGKYKMANWYMRRKRANAALYNNRSVLAEQIDVTRY